MKLSVILNNLLILLPVVVSVAVHEAIRWPVDILLLRQLELRFLLLAGHARDRTQDDSLHAAANALISWLHLLSSINTCIVRKIDLTKSQMLRPRNLLLPIFFRGPSRAHRLLLEAALGQAPSK